MATSRCSCVTMRHKINRRESVKLHAFLFFCRDHNIHLNVNTNREQQIWKVFGRKLNNNTFLCHKTVFAHPSCQRDGQMAHSLGSCKNSHTWESIKLHAAFAFWSMSSSCLGKQRVIFWYIIMVISFNTYYTLCFISSKSTPETTLRAL